MAGCPVAYIYLYKALANLGFHISESLQRNFLKRHRLTKFGTINRFMKKNFCFNEKHKKWQFCVTSSKRSVKHLVRGLPSSVCVVDCAIDGFIGDQISLSKGDALGF